MQVIHTSSNEVDGLESCVHIREGGWYMVSLRDTDADQILPSHKLFRTEEEAILYANKITNV